ncbi:Bacterial extracellular solute-binding protein [Acididesulfobacillus acetoxydans]|uniref:Bacterial extracellular solute-binding protein n=1 Tax=Acididesulfobacillus acetoxydans TaxID=1561005 RepID=A0A8S0XVX2_9FIRM|nr:ABC transporter substrate-binding protein [Acididesulfobacillus acetoxydans]CAA7600657.1 Bacterial extracellular solute-binding protein [Acididesulfobacillus acetoxydans]CEJ09438.1 sn-glycerol-3-phosphate-binding periplasmic protein UgpB [Acididesulfobacillus acetoxydans]
MKKRQTLKILSVLLVLGLLLVTGCGTGTTKSGQTAGGPITVTFWHSMGGVPAKTLTSLIDKFNATHKDIQVKLVYQGSYDDAFNKLKASPDQGPDLFQVYDIGTRYMIDAGLATPMQNFIDQSKFDLSQFEPHVLHYYQVGGKLYSMPFNTSVPVLYYNKTMFKAAGLDPNKPPLTFAEVEKDAKALTATSGGKKVYGFSQAIYGWFFEQYLARDGALYVNNGNGRDKAATESLVNSPAGVQILTWWKKMIDDGVATNLGRQTSATQAAFGAQQIAMTIDSCGILPNLTTAAAGKFQIGIAPLPRGNDATDSGPIIGGGSLWILKNKPKAEQEAAWKVVQWLTQPAQMAAWTVGTGYLPINKAAVNEQTYKDFLAKYPSYQVALDQLHNTPENRVTEGGRIGVFTSARATVENAIEQVVLNKATPQAALDAAAKKITSAIQEYNQTMGIK